jgi:glycosyltransferase involved in cell wall biosynthesis
MRVLHLIPSISPLRGGPSQAVLALAAAQRARGLDAVVLTTNDHGDQVLADLPIGRWCDRQEVPVLAFARWSPPIRALREFAVAPGLLGGLRRELAAADLLHVHALFSFASTAGMALARQQQVPYLVRSIGQLNRWSLRQSPRRKRLLLKLVERRNLNGARALHFTSDAEREEAADLGLRPPPIVLPLGVALPQLDPTVPVPADQAVRWLFLSRIHPKKQLPVLFEALADLQRRQPAARWLLDVAGEGDASYVEQLQQLAQRLGLAERIRWCGFAAGEVKAALLARADWFVLPSASENFGIAAAEALAAGTPVILSPGVALAPDVRQAGAGLVCEPEPAALAQALERALQPPSAAMVEAARALAAERYSWPAIAAALEQHYQAILSGGQLLQESC